VGSLYFADNHFYARSKTHWSGMLPCCRLDFPQVVREWFADKNDTVPMTLASVHKLIRTRGYTLPPTSTTNVVALANDDHLGDTAAVSRYVLQAIQDQVPIELCKQSTESLESSSAYSEPRKVRRPGAPAPLRHIQNIFHDDDAETSSEVLVLTKSSIIIPKARAKMIARRGGGSAKPKPKKTQTPDTVKATSAIKPKPTGWSLFSLKNRSKLRQEMPSLAFGDLSRIVGQRWTTLSKTEKDKWNKKAKGDESDCEADVGEREGDGDGEGVKDDDEDTDDDVGNDDGSEADEDDFDTPVDRRKTAAKRKGNEARESPRKSKAKKMAEADTCCEQNRFEENNLERDEDLPKEWRDLPKEIKSRVMEVFWIRYNCKVHTPLLTGIPSLLLILCFLIVVA